MNVTIDDILVVTILLYGLLDGSVRRNYGLVRLYSGQDESSSFGTYGGRS
jgi:hypothetical protein